MLDDYHWLTGPQADSILQDGSLDAGPLHVAAQRLRRTLSASRTHLVLQQLQLRRRAATKFRAADRLFFTERSLQQATGDVLAGYKAERFADRGSVIDLCCGIGGDLMALGGRNGRCDARSCTHGVDADPLMTLLAAANCRRAGLAVQLRAADAADCDVAAHAGWHIDPDRRAAGRRTTRLPSFAPDIDQLRVLLERNQNAAVKLAPATSVPDDWQASAEREWIEHHRECRQQVAWFGELASTSPDLRRGLCRATWIGGDGRQRDTFAGPRDQAVAAARRLGRYLYEPSPALLAAGLVGAVAMHDRLEPIAPGAAYLTSDEEICRRLLSRFEIADVLPFDVRRVKRLLAERGYGRLELKCRHAPVSIDRLRRQLKVTGDQQATVIVTTISDRVTAIVARRIVPPSP